MIDRFSRWPEVAPLTDMSAATVARAFVETWVSRFGVPHTITTDRGAQFESSMFSELVSVLGCTRLRTTSYHPQSNGLIERFHRTLKAALTATGSPSFWYDRLPLVMLGIRSSLKSDLGCSAAELVYGSPLRLPGEFFSSGDYPSNITPSSYAGRLTTVMRELKPVAPRTFSTLNIFVPEALQTCSHVSIRVDGIKKALHPPYEGPFRVISRTQKHLKVDKAGRSETISINIKTCNL